MNNARIAAKHYERARLRRANRKPQALHAPVDGLDHERIGQSALREKRCCKTCGYLLCACVFAREYNCERYFFGCDFASREWTVGVWRLRDDDSEAWRT
jgi:hypothetical protein